jgi:hypothetical protein
MTTHYVTNFTELMAALVKSKKGDLIYYDEEDRTEKTKHGK